MSPTVGFELVTPIARGGMGVVWEARHPSLTRPVALKAITATRARSDRFLAAFRREVRAVAGLAHPGVVAVFDHGAVDEATAAASSRLAPKRAMAPGSPFLAMELAAVGTLDRVWDPVSWTWPTLRALLKQVLAALAHAHAAGVIHLDIKPGNVLVFGEEGAVPRVKLADFGLAVASRHDGMRAGVTGAGTPLYMAPELFDPGTPDVGPWTDLYMVGCLGWELATGLPPFLPESIEGDTAASHQALAEAHRELPPPPLRPQRPAPPRFEAWLRRALAKAPEDRFQHAADAARLLDSLGDAEDAPASPSPLWVQRPSHGASTSTVVPVKVGAPSRVGPPRPSQPPDRDSTAMPAMGPLPSPDTWSDHPEASSRRGTPAPPPGLGLGLWGLRAAPLVGRATELNRLWGALRDVAGGHGARCLVLQGGAGTGKTSLAERLARYAEEQGLASTWRAAHDSGEAPGVALRRMIERGLGTAGVEPATARTRARRWEVRHLRGLPEADRASRKGGVERMLDRLAKPTRSGSGRQTAAERHAVVVDLLTLGTVERPAVVILDDVQWSAESIELVRFVLRVRPTLPLLVLATVRTEDTVAGSPADDALHALLDHPKVERLELSPLPEEQRRALVGGLLGLTGELASQVEVRTAGNPLFAVQLVGDWVSRGVLVPDASGFRLRPGERALLPDDIHALWTGRIAQIAAELPAAGPLALELAAVLGRRVTTREWQACWGALGESEVASLDGAAEALAARGLAQLLPGEWSFGHPMLREALERTADSEGRLARLHSACADGLSTAWPEGTRGLAERRGRHLVGAGRDEEAAPELQRAADERWERSEYREAQGLLDGLDLVLDRLGAEEHDARRLRSWLQRTRLFGQNGRVAASEALAGEVVDLLRGPAGPRLPASTQTLLPAALAAWGAVAGLQGRYSDWAARSELAVEAAARFNDDRVHASARVARADATKMLGRYDEAERLLDGVPLALEALGETRRLADCRLLLAQLARHQGRLEEAEEGVRAALELQRKVGSRWAAASGSNTLGDVLRSLGRFDEAEAAFRHSAAEFEALGSSDAPFPVLNLGQLLRARGRGAEADALLLDVAAAAHSNDHFAAELAAHVLLLPGQELLESSPGWEERVRRIEELLEGRTVADSDLEAAARLAAERAEEVGNRGREALALRLAALFSARP